MIKRNISLFLLTLFVPEMAHSASVWEVQNSINDKIQNVIDTKDMTPSDISIYLNRLTETVAFRTTDISKENTIAAPIAIENNEATWSQEPDIELVPLELVLSNLSIQMGANFHVSLRLAQKDPGARVLIIRSGNLSLEELKTLADERLGEGIITKEDDAYTAHLPLFIWQTGGLQITEGDNLFLDQSVGAFIANSGALIIRGGSIASNNKPNNKLNEFKPFITTALMGYTQIANAKLSDLGFEGYRALKGVSFSSSAFFAPLGASFIKSSELDQVGSVELNGMAGFEFSQNIVKNSVNNGMEVRQSSNINISHNVFLDSGNHGIKISDGSFQIGISQNAVLKSNGNGIFMSDGSNVIDVSSNVIAQNKRTGLGVQRVACLDAKKNLIASNSGNGISIEQSFAIDLLENEIVTNKVGTKISDRLDLGEFTLSSNKFIANGVGVTGSRATGISFVENDFSLQFPRVLGGELGQYTNAFLDALDAQEANFEIPKHQIETGLTEINLPVLAIDRCMERKVM